MVEAPISHRSLGPAYHSQVPHLGPSLAVQSVKKVEIDLLHLQALQLLIEIAVKSLCIFHQPYGEFRCHLHFLTISILECPAHYPFTLPFMVGVRSVDIVDTVVYGVTHHPYRLGFIHLFCFFVGKWQSHHPETQHRYLPV